VTEGEHRAIRTVEALCSRMSYAQYESEMRAKAEEQVGQLRIRLGEVGDLIRASYHEDDHRRHDWSHDLDLIRRVIRERDDAVARFEQVKTLAQLALGSEPGAAILELVAELKRKLEEKGDADATPTR
jgi:hypothetical protein